MYYLNTDIENNSSLIKIKSTTYKVSDFMTAKYEEWLNDIYKNHDINITTPDAATQVLKKFSCKLSKKIISYQRNGSFNNELSPDKVTLAAEITDFKFYESNGNPKIDDLIYENQRKEAYYFIDVLITLCEGLKICIPIEKLAIISIKEINQSYECGFTSELSKIAIIRD